MALRTGRLRAVAAAADLVGQRHEGAAILGIDRQLEATAFLRPATGFRSEKLTAVEAGYRGQPSTSISVSVNGFGKGDERAREKLTIHRSARVVERPGLTSIGTW